jgi:hypothetical protein
MCQQIKRSELIDGNHKVKVPARVLRELYNDS